MHLKLVFIGAFSYYRLWVGLAAAQPCNPDSLAHIPGKFNPGMKGSIHNVSAADLAKEREVLANLHKKISSAFRPTGCEITYSNSFGYNLLNGKNWIADPYDYEMFFLKYECGTSKKNNLNYQPAVASNTQAFILINHFWSQEAGMTLYAAGLPDDHHSGYFALDTWPQKKEGYYYWPLDNDWSPRGRTEYAYLITYDNQLPFRSLTRREYIPLKMEKLRKAILERKKITVATDAPHFAEWQEALREKEARLQELETYLRTMPAAELDLPAIIERRESHDEFRGFKKEGDAGVVHLAVPNMAYYNPKLPKWVPQFISIVVGRDTKDDVYISNVRQFDAAIDFNYLRSMLGKSDAASPAASTPQQPTLQVSGSSADSKNNINFDVYANVPEKGFVSTPAANIRNAVEMPVVAPPIKTAAMRLQLTTGNRHAFLKKLLYDIEQQLHAKEKDQTAKLLQAAGNDAVDLADLGVMLFYKGNTPLGLWCLAQAAAFEPESDYILNNLAGVLITAGATPRALPIARYLKEKYPANTTVLNNLGQALFALGELPRSKQVLDSCLRLYRNHPQANYTRAAIAEKEGKQQEAAGFIERSLKGAYNEETEAFAQKKNIKIDWSNVLYRRRPFDASYINALALRPPPQCRSVEEAADLEGRWNAWSESVHKAVKIVEAGLEEADMNQIKDFEKLQKNRIVQLPYMGLFAHKAARLFLAYQKQASELGAAQQQFLEIRYQPQKAALEAELEKQYERIYEKYRELEGEGKGSMQQQLCAELNQASNQFLQKMAALNDEFNSRFSEPLRLLAIEMMWWSQFLPEPASYREAKYYANALQAVSPLLMHTEIIYPCPANATPKQWKWDTVAMQPYCPISFKFKVKMVKVTGDCSKLEFEVEAAGLVAGYERDFVNKKSTLAFGVSASVDFKNEKMTVGKTIPEIIEVTGAGAGGKMQGYIEWGKDGRICDVGLRGEVSVEGPLTDKGDIKVNGRIGVNAGIDVTASEATRGIVETINYLTGAVK